MVRERAERGEGPSARLRSSLSVAELRQLISLMNSSDIEEITIEHAAHGLHLTLRKPAPVAISTAAAAAVSDGVDGYEMADPSPAADEAPREHTVDVRAPLVGVFRAAPRPGKSAIQAGDAVREGQAVAAIEALNVLNEVEIESAGRVKEVLVGDGQAVEYGQVLMVVEPQAG
ncbi:MAG TPA: biotin/lipoyl-containing protein [Ktedonobacterales bacterium]|jgi:acetyl-CoA carboxylase biotin carboxyl carrier protein|nr:biotin/lipoyl-containing protein [Ktedonobacterales bacterium]